MLTSLLSIYIAATISPDLNTNSIPFTKEEPISIVKTANIDLQDFIETQVAPVKNSQFIAPVIDAKSSIAVDLNSGSILFEKNAHQRRSIASITKLMTAIIILEENNLNEIVTVSSNAANTEGSSMYLLPGEQITVENLLYGLMVSSANDSAVALAEYNAQNVSTFVEKMNQKASALGLVNTNYANPTGLDQTLAYSSAYDVAKLAQYVYQNDFIKKAAAIQSIDVQSISGNYNHKLETTNKLLDSYLKIKGLKTGKTDAAGLCLTVIAENDQGKEIVTVVLNSPARFTETKVLVDWVFRAYNW